VPDREVQWAEMMRAARRGDAGTYHRLLHELAPVAALTLPLLALAAAVSWELLTSPVHTWSARALGSNSRLCLASITALSSAPLATLLLALRAGAPRWPALAGAVAGLLAGALAATLYATHCPDDSPLFVALWYTIAVGLIMAAGSAAGHRVLRW
jgi:hypothetical protein